ncbi:unnamed protein product, partial [Pylaiella littoralis]
RQILTALQILGRGNCFDDINQLSLMSKSMAAAIFHKFCKSFAKEMFEEHIYLPTGTYQDEVMDCYRKLGFTGAIGSTDVTHVGWGMCLFTLGRSFTGMEGFQPWRSRLPSTTRGAPLARPFRPPPLLCRRVPNQQWVTLMAPSKYPGDVDDAAFSKMLESVRKDVECFFGILKGRFRTLKLRLAYHCREDIDDIFFTCCILHNML